MALWMKASALVLALALAACEQVTADASAPQVEAAHGPSVETLGPCEVTTASYETVGEPFIRTWCTPCHHSELSGPDRPQGSESVNLDTLELVVAHLDRIEARAVGDDPTMPPGGGPSATEIERFALWLDCGAVEAMPSRGVD